MSINLSLARILSFVLAASLLLSSCGAIQVIQSGEMQTETHSIDADLAESVKVRIEMEQGMLDIRSGSARLMEGTFQYNVSEWKPQVDYWVDGSEGNLVVTQPDQDRVDFVQNGENTWELRLGEWVPMELVIEMGAGESELDLTRIDLTQLTIDTGAGSVDLDLRGTWSHDLEIAINGGIGEVTLHLPDDIGARVEIEKGLGNVRSGRMDRDGNVYVNDSYGKSPNTLFIRIETGAGDITLDA